MNSPFRKYILFVLSFLLLTIGGVYGQNESLVSSDSLNMAMDSSNVDVIAKDSLQADTITPPKKKTKIDAPITYSAKDSIVLSGSGNAYLYGQSKILYEEIELTANTIHLNTDSSLVNAIGMLTEDGELEGSPVFKDGGEEYQAKSLRYNFDTKKGYVVHGVVQQDDAYIISEESKKLDNDIMCMANGKYTTCSCHEHPHFYLNLTKAKVKQKKWVTTGPAYFVLLDVPLPLVIPFGYFPFTKSYSSGVIIPSYGDDLTRGFFLSNGGYYWAINDYVDLALTGDIYTKGSWAVRGQSSYIKRYKFRGNVNFDYRVDKTGEKELPDYMKVKSFSLNWTHTQDPKSNPNRTFSASVNFSSSAYDRSNIDNYYNQAALSQNIKSSSISFGYSFPETPFSISSSLLANQRTADSTISLTLPDLTITMSRIYPFKRKNAIGNERWYEKIYMSYSGRISNSIETKENLLLDASFMKDWKKGISHSIPVGMSFNVLRYLSITPSINYNERWYFESIGQYKEYATDTEIQRDTTYGFYRAGDFNMGVSASTKIYGFFTPLRSIFGDKIDRIRHVITPTIGFSYRPDFSDPFWGSWKSYERPTSATDPTLQEIRYSPYAGSIFGTSSAGKSNSLNFSLNNNLEMKLKQENDSTGEAEYKTVSLIDAFSINNSYNFAADSMRWGNFNANLRLKIVKNFNLNLSGVFDTYLYALNENDNPIRINKPRWEEGKFPRLISTSSAFSYTLNNQTFKKKAKEEKENEGTEEEEKAKKKTVGDDGYTTVNVPWSLSFDYSVRFGNTSEFNKEKLEYDRELTHNIGIRGNFSLTSNWHFNFSATYDFNAEEITYSSLGIRRNLHCWSMSANIVPFGVYKTYNFMISVNSSMLSDLKYEKRSDYYQVNWY